MRRMSYRGNALAWARARSGIDVVVALAAIGAGRVEVEAVGILRAGIAVDPGVTPRVGLNVLGLEHRAPIWRGAGALEQGAEAFLGARIARVVALEHVERGLDRVERRRRGLLLGVLTATGELGHDDGGEHRDDDQHEQQLDERERAPACGKSISFSSN